MLSLTGGSTPAAAGARPAARDRIGRQGGARLRVHDEIEVAHAVARLLVDEAGVRRREHMEALGEHLELGGEDGELAALRLACGEGRARWGGFGRSVREDVGPGGSAGLRAGAAGSVRGHAASGIPGALAAEGGAHPGSPSRRRCRRGG